MKKRFIFTILLSLVIFCFSYRAHAAFNIDAKVDVPASCTVTDTDGVSHNYSETGTYFAICAIDAATKNGSISNTQLSNQYPSMGLFITAINDVVADPNSQYWAIYQNGNTANLGVTLLPIATGDTIIFQLNDFSDNNLGDQVTLHINSLIPVAVLASGGGQLVSPSTPPVNESITPIITVATPAVTPALPTKPTFDTTKAFNFLNTQQKDEGSFGIDLYTDWTAVALASPNYQGQVLKLIKYLDEDKLENPSLTDYERHAMALMALGLNPYNTNGENYVEKIISQFDGKQFGDVKEDNDDIFALIVLQNAGYSQDDKMINKDITFILGKQNENGSWDESPDMTGATMEALSAFSSTPEVKDSLSKAKEFLKNNQKGDGSWNENVSSTAWALEGILSLNEKTEDWIPARNASSIADAGGINGNTPIDYVATVQDTDGGVKDDNIQNKIWETAYVTSALSGKTWNQIMQKFDKPAQKTKSNNLVIKTINKIENQNTASAINAINNSPDRPQTTTSKKNWFTKLLDNIFGSF